MFHAKSCKTCFYVVSELSLITLHWFLTIFASVVHTRILLRLWDLFFYEGSTILFQVTLGMLKLKASQFPLTVVFSSSIDIV